MSRLKAPGQKARTQTNIHSSIKHAEKKDLTQIQNKLLFVFFLQFSFFLLQRFLKEMLNYRLGAVNIFYSGFTPV